MASRHFAPTRACLIVLLLLLVASVSACDLPGGPGESTPAAATPTAAPAPTASSQPDTPTPPPPTEPPTPSGPVEIDRRVDAEKLFHDSHDPRFRSPGGSVAAGTAVVLRLRAAPGDLTGVDVRLWNSTSESEELVPMKRISDDMWEVTLDTPKEGAALWYRFIARDGNGTGYYYDDEARDGGVGVGQGFTRDDDYLIMAYRPDFETPDWLKGGVVYQIFPDRFNNGDPANDKPAGTPFYDKVTIFQPWDAKPRGTDDFFGGDLRGVIDRLDYLQSLGVTAIYFNPIFKSPSNHRYDTTDYAQIEPSLGTMETFKELSTKAKEKGIRLILDGVFNHSSSDSLYFDKFSRHDTQGAFESRQSPYFGWYNFEEWPKKYKAWFGYDTLPAYTESEEVKRFLFKDANSVARRWTREGIGGWRLDAAEQKSHPFWREFRTAVKEQDSEAVIIGEFWENSAPWLAGDQWDGTMNYRFKDAVLGWLASTRPVEQMARKLDSIREDYPPQALAVSMSIIGTHDTRRALTEVRGDKNALKMLALLQFAFPGLPTVYYGDEAGLEGGGDPDDRRTYPWGSEDTSLLEHYRALGRARKESSALRTGEFVSLGYNNELDVYAFARKDDNGVAVAALNRSQEERELELPIKDVAAVGATLEEVLGSGAKYTVQGETLKVRVPGRAGLLLLGK